MDPMDIYGLVWTMNSHTPCITEKVMGKFTIIVRTILDNGEKHFTTKQAEKIILAMETSAHWHNKYYRKDTITPYIMHPLEVALLFFEHDLYDFKITISAILHDTVEDEEAKDGRYRKRKFITKNFGSPIRDIVELVTKPRSEIGRKNYFEHMRREKRPATMVRAGMVKLADCARNTETLHVFSEENRKIKIIQIRKEYPPLAEKVIHTIWKLPIPEPKKRRLIGITRKLLSTILENIASYE